VLEIDLTIASNAIWLDNTINLSTECSQFLFIFVSYKQTDAFECNLRRQVGFTC
jgi:hypothetical protein